MQIWKKTPVVSVAYHRTYANPLWNWLFGVTVSFILMDSEKDSDRVLESLLTSESKFKSITAESRVEVQVGQKWGRESALEFSSPGTKYCSSLLMVQVLLKEKKTTEKQKQKTKKITTTTKQKQTNKTGMNPQLFAGYQLWPLYHGWWGQSTLETYLLALLNKSSLQTCYVVLYKITYHSCHHLTVILFTQSQSVSTQ